MPLKIENAYLTDIDELLKLYFNIYGSSYPVLYATDPKVMADTLSSGDHLWLVTRDSETHRIVGSLVFELDRVNRVGKVAALVVHSDYRNRSIAHRMVSAGVEELLAESSEFNSLYTTTRTHSVAPQVIFLKNGFLPLGIFPNAHKLKEFETTTLLAKFKPGVLERREKVPLASPKLGSLYEVLNRHLGLSSGEPVAIMDPAPLAAAASLKPELDFELIFAPKYVLRRFYETFRDPYDRFYPFHLPNLLMASTNGEVEIYAHFSPSDHYCTIVSLNRPFFELSGRLRGLLAQVKDRGISYLEVLIGADHRESIETLLNMQFLPSAVYPAFREGEGGKMQDFVVMTRTMEPLNFRGMAIEKCFKPYVDQYVDQWKRMHLDTLEIFNDYK